MQKAFENSLLDEEVEFNINEFDILSKSIYQNYIKVDKLNTIPFSQFYVSFIAYMARCLTIKHAHIKMTWDNNKILPLNVYCFQFAQSGAGKGKTKNTLEFVFKSYIDEYQRKFKTEKQNIINDINNSEDDNKNKIASKKQMIEERFTLVDIITDATLAGVRNLNNNYEMCNNKFGGLFFFAGEFAEYVELINCDTNKKEFFNFLLDSYDMGKYDGKIKATEILKPIDFMIVNCLMVTSVHKLLQGNNIKNFNNMLESGMARRAFMCYPSKKEMEISNIEKHEELFREDPFGYTKQLKNYEINNTLLSKEEIKNHIDLIIDNINSNNELILSEECILLYDVYKNHCIFEQKKEKNSILSSEIGNRHWKALKLAGIIHAINSRFESRLITTDSLFSAIKITENYGFHLKRFMAEKVENMATAILSILKQHLNTFVTRSYFSSDKNIQQFNGSLGFKKSFDDYIEIIPSLAEDEGLCYVKTVTGKNNNGLAYCVYNPKTHKAVQTDSNGKAFSIIPLHDKNEIRTEDFFNV